MMCRNGWDICVKCGGKGCDNCNHMGRIVASGYKLCVECGGFGSVGYDSNDEQDYGSFVEICPTCNGEGVVKSKMASMV